MFLLALILGWIIGGGWMSGYCKAAASSDPNLSKDKLWLFSALGFLLAPFFAIYFFIVSPLAKVSHDSKMKQIKKAKIRIAEEKKARIELKEAEELLEREFEELEKHDAKKKQMFLSLAKEIDRKVFKK